MRRLRIAVPAQLSLMVCAADGGNPATGLWESLPAPAQAELLLLFARLIARSVIIEDEGAV